MHAAGILLCFDSWCFVFIHDSNKMNYFCQSSEWFWHPVLLQETDHEEWREESWLRPAGAQQEPAQSRPHHPWHWHRPMAATPHVIMGPGARNATCHLSGRYEQQWPVACVLVFSMSSSSSLWYFESKYVMCRSSSLFRGSGDSWCFLSSHVSQCRVTWLHCDESFLSNFKLFLPACSLNLSIRCPEWAEQRRESQKFLFPLASDTWLGWPGSGFNLTPSNPHVTFALHVPGQL